MFGQRNPRKTAFLVKKVSSKFSLQLKEHNDALNQNYNPETKYMYYKSFSDFRNKMNNVDKLSIMQLNIKGIHDYRKFF